MERGKKEKRHVLLPDHAMVTGDEKVDLSEPGAASRPDNLEGVWGRAFFAEPTTHSKILKCFFIFLLSE